MNRSDLVFVVEDTNNNKFGGYITSTINKYDSSITDSNAFVFSLKSNGRLKGMKKFNIIKPEKVFYLYNKSYNRLFEIGGGDICICKKGSGYKPYCLQRSFNYEGISNALCNGRYFTPKRITVIQMK